MAMTNESLPNSDANEITYLPSDKSDEAYRWRIEKIRLKQKAEADAKAAVEAEKAPAAPLEAVQLEMWPQEVRVFPNALLRSALFSSKKIRGNAKKRTLLRSTADVEIRFKGERFIQPDLDVCEALFHLARLVPLGEKVEFTAHSLLKLLGRGTGKADHERLKEDIARLTAGLIELKWKEKDFVFGGALIEHYYRDDATGKYIVTLSKKIKKLFDTGHTYTDFAERQLLGQNNLAKWLHSFYATHANPYPYAVKTLKELSESGSPLYEFRRLLKDALTRLATHKIITSWSIDGQDLVHVHKPPNGSQKRHLDKRKNQKEIMRKISGM